MNAREILEKAHDIVQDGWCQFALTDYAGRYCASGAIMQAQYGTTGYAPELLTDGAYLDAREALIKAIAQDYPAWRDGFLLGAITTWNNMPDRTQEEVVLIFKKAAYSLDE
jgi:hypothetical protein